MRGQPGVIAYLQPQVLDGSKGGTWFDFGREYPSGPAGIKSAAEQAKNGCRLFRGRRWRVVEIVQRTIIAGAAGQEVRAQ